MADERLLNLSEHLCFVIYACSREMTKLYRPFLDEENLTYPQYLCLVVLYESGECTVKELGERLFLDSGTLTPLLKRMQEAGLVTRKRSAEDERKVVVSLTELGRATREKATSIPFCVASSIGMEHKDSYLQMLTEMTSFLNKVHQANQT